MKIFESSCAVLSIVFLVLKIVGIIAWSWVAVFSPAIVWLVVSVLVWSFLGIVAYAAPDIFEKAVKNRKK